MFKIAFAAASLALLTVGAGCGSSPESSGSGADQALSQDSATGTLSLAAATKQVLAIRLKFDPTNEEALLTDESLAPAYLKDVAPIFARIAPADKIQLGGNAFTDVSLPIMTGAILDLGLLDGAIASYADLDFFVAYWGGLSTSPEFFTKLQALIARSPASPLSDLQVLELAEAAYQVDLFDALTTLGWSTARKAVAADAKSLVDDEGTYAALNIAIFGAGSPNDFGTGPDPLVHDIDVTNTFAVTLYKRAYSELPLVAPDDGEILVDLGGHLNQEERSNGKRATNGIALAESVISASELKTLKLQLDAN